jgi:general secretion pathway protein D
MSKPKFLPVVILLGISVSGCMTQSQHQLDGMSDAQQLMPVSQSYLASQEENTNKITPRDDSSMNADNIDGSDHSQRRAIEMLETLGAPNSVGSGQVLSGMFSESEELQVTAENMSLRDFAHYVFGDLLNVNYILDERLASKSDEGPDRVTLSLESPISARSLFKIASKLFLQRNVEILYGDGAFYINDTGDSSGGKGLVIGVGRDRDDVPDTVRPILQVVPLEYGIKISITRTLNDLVDAKITPDYDRNVIFFEGSRSSILQALDLIDLLDTPATRSRYVGLIGLTYISPSEFTGDITVLLENEGILSAVGKPSQRNLVFVSLEQLGAVAVFAGNQTLLDRVRYWSKILDVPGQGGTDQYFLYHPKYARALDLGESLSALLGVANNSSSRPQARAAASNVTTGNAPSASRVNGINSADLKMIVDERANALVFYTSGNRYQALLPLLKKLDTMPKQVMLDVTIAEVSLQDEFKYGVEWALERSEVNLTTAGAFGVSSIGGLGLIIDGAEGPLTANFFNSSSLVNVLSNPSQVVRDGATTNFNVGSSISVVGQTTQDPINGERQTTTTEYRKTGVDVTVTPTVNAKGIVVMEIEMSISNTVPDSSGSGGNPDIFERMLKTEVVAKSGQTVMLAGLISENKSVGGTGAPGLESLPLLGNLFKSNSNNRGRTELVMLITPRVVESVGEWNDLLSNFRQGLRYIELENNSVN